MGTLTGARQHLSADGYPVVEGAKFWDLDLRVVEIVQVEVTGNPYGDTGETQTWHATTHGRYDTLSGALYTIGRLARRYEGRDAEFLPVGTLFNARGSAARRVGGAS
jgi:hypothetical protein